MGTKLLSLFLVSFQLFFLMTCATGTLETDLDPDQKIAPLKLPEVRIATTKGDMFTGKLTQFENRTLTLLPYPYWNVDSLKIPLDDIARIEVKEKKKRSGSGFIAGFSYSFIIVGFLAGLSSQYDEDYEAALLGSGLAGAAGGLVGFAVGAIMDIGAKDKYEFATMSASEKVASLWKIMRAR